MVLNTDLARQKGFISNKGYAGTRGGLHIYGTVPHKKRLARLYAIVVKHLEQRFRMRLGIGHF